MQRYAFCLKILEDTRIPEGRYVGRLYFKARGVRTFKMRMSKLEVRNPSQTRHPKGLSPVLSLQNLNFGNVSDFYARGGVYLEKFYEKMRKKFKILFILSVNTSNKGGHND